MKTLIDKYPLVAGLFQTHRGDLSLLSWADEQPFIMEDAEELLAELEGAVIGVEKLAINSSSAKGKFFALVAELRFAALFHRLDARVEILLDEAFGSDAYTPDLLVTFDGGLEMLIDVVWGSSGTAPVSEKLDQRLSATTLPYWTEYALSGELSTPKTSGRARAEDEALADEIANLVHAALEVAHDAGEEYGLIRVFGPPTSLRTAVEYVDLGPFEDEFGSMPNWLGTFRFRKSPNGQPLAGGGVNYPHWVNSDDQQGGLERKLKDKASKRSKLPSRYRSTPFLVAVENSESDLTPVAALSFLTGSRHWHWRKSGKVSALTDEVRILLGTGWNPILGPWDYEGTPNMTMSDYGKFYESRTGWAGELSGVLLSQHSNTKLQWFPNPFARPEINEAKLLQVPLSLEKLGAPWPDAEREEERISPYALEH